MNDTSGDTIDFNARQIGILKLMLLPATQIGKRAFLHPSSIRLETKIIRATLRAKTNQSAVFKAIRLGLIQFDEVVTE